MISYKASRTLFYALLGDEFFSMLYALDIDVYKDICKKGDYFTLIKNKTLQLTEKSV